VGSIHALKYSGFFPHWRTVNLREIAAASAAGYYSHPLYLATDQPIHEEEFVIGQLPSSLPPLHHDEYDVEA
jgi:hypothetical protein